MLVAACWCFLVVVWCLAIVCSVSAGWGASERGATNRSTPMWTENQCPDAAGGNFIRKYRLTV